MRGTSILAVTLAVVLMLAVSLSHGLVSVKLLAPVKELVQFEWLKHATLKSRDAIHATCNGMVATHQIPFRGRENVKHRHLFATN